MLRTDRKEDGVSQGQKPKQTEIAARTVPAWIWGLMALVLVVGGAVTLMAIWNVELQKEQIAVQSRAELRIMELRLQAEIAAADAKVAAGEKRHRDALANGDKALADAAKLELDRAKQASARVQKNRPENRPENRVATRRPGSGGLEDLGGGIEKGIGMSNHPLTGLTVEP